MGDLKYRVRISTSIDKGLKEALYGYSEQSDIPVSRLMDKAIACYLKHIKVPYTKQSLSKQDKP